jgi:glycosyltransferase involved in cell wall biosynthesis
MAEQPSVSVIVPLYNAERYVAAALDSIFAQQQTALDVLVVDDGSQDDSLTALIPYAGRITLIRQANAGPAAARNRALRQAGGDVVAFLDADDLWPTGRLAAQLAVLAAQPECAVVLGQVENFVSPELDEAEQQRLARSAEQTGSVHIGAMLVRRSTFELVGPFDETVRHGEFIAWWARLQQLQLPVVTLSQTVLRRRLHQTNMTRLEPDGRRNYLAALRAQLAARRAAGPRDETA